MAATMSTDPFGLFDAWFAEAQESEPNDPNAMALATADASGRPAARMVLLKGHGPGGFVFYTNRESRKAHDLKENMQAALLFHWKSLRRQIRIEGATRSWVRGRPNNPVRSPPARSSRGGSRRCNSASRVATCRARRIGVGIA